MALVAATAAEVERIVDDRHEEIGSGYHATVLIECVHGGIIA